MFFHCNIFSVNVVDLMTLQTHGDHPHSLSDKEYDGIFPSNVPVIFAFHGYPTLIHRLTYRRANSSHMHVHGFKEEGTTTTPFDMVVLNELDRFHLALNAIRRLPNLDGSKVKKLLSDKLLEHKEYIYKHGEDMPEIRNWKWSLK